MRTLRAAYRFLVLFVCKCGAILLGFVEQATLGAKLLARWRKPLELGEPELLFEKFVTLLQCRRPPFQCADIVAQFGRQSGKQFG